MTTRFDDERNLYPSVLTGADHAADVDSRGKVDLFLGLHSLGDADMRKTLAHARLAASLVVLRSSGHTLRCVERVLGLSNGYFTKAMREDAKPLREVTIRAVEGCAINVSEKTPIVVELPLKCTLMPFVMASPTERLGWESAPYHVKGSSAGVRYGTSPSGRNATPSHLDAYQATALRMCATAVPVLEVADALSRHARERSEYFPGMAMATIVDLVMNGLLTPLVAPNTQIKGVFDHVTATAGVSCDPVPTGNNKSRVRYSPLLPVSVSLGFIASRPRVIVEARTLATLKESVDWCVAYYVSAACGGYFQHVYPRKEGGSHE